MKYLLVTFFSLTFFRPALAVVFSSSIHTIDYGKKNEPHLIKFDNGRVGYVGHINVNLVKALNAHRQSNQNLAVELDKNFNIVSVKSVAPTENDQEEDQEEEINSNLSYQPTVLNTLSDANNILKKMRGDYNKEGECYNRAYVWTYEAFKRTGLNSMKLFMFFTNHYIRTYRFDWWFHVTPMVFVGSTKRTLDRRYTSSALQTKDWTDVFIKSKRTCPTIKKYKSYENNQEKEDCYLLPVSMYYIVPRDIEKRDLSGVEKDHFIRTEIDRAYRNAFTP